jgi:hypothetical protein
VELQAPTPFPARLYRTQLHYRDLVLATLVSKAAFETDEQGNPVAVQDQLDINEGDVETPLGVLESDVVPIKEGCDFAVYGSAISRNGPVARMDVTVKLGTVTRSVRVTGDRAWVPSHSGVSISKTVPFTTMPLDYSRAFGGTAPHPVGIQGSEPSNPLGRGWVLDVKQAAGTRLPNVEEVDQCITRCDQTPLPAGLLPLPRTSALRGTRGIKVDLKEKTTKLTPLAFVSSHPRMHLERFPALSEGLVEGMSASGRWHFRMPDPSLTAVVQLGKARHWLHLTPDTLCLVPEQRRMWVVSRRAFIYQFVAERLRTVRLLAGKAPYESPTTTIAMELASPTKVPIAAPEAPENMPIPWEMLRELHPLTDILENLPLLPSG